ncbi:hypothetical protein SAMN02745116_00914 [Pilibacter termitis]|uniref:Short-chain dehydrogenase n=1 Tax=Pilibacter termitis TaxID=263852 RepID=A0A1T4M3N1_9ENTE|nr:SDR family oxidoreductase [Pilibacter termitis]SJZ61573.1 hypothetical protein SAMN02745116_00914 [Pilibacter termitis]
MRQYALITGATSGIGRELTYEFAKNQHDIVIVGRNEDKLQALEHELLSKYNVDVKSIRVDLLEKNAVEQIKEQLRKWKIVISFLVNNAGFNEVGEFAKTDIAKELDMIQLHIVFTTELTKLLLIEMQERKYGKILNICSTGSYIPCPYNVVYAATKSYLLSFSKALDIELKGSGITVTAISPGAVKTSFAEKANLEEALLFKIGVMEAKKVAQVAYRDLMKGKSTHIIGLYNKLLVIFTKILPKKVVQMASKKMMNVE